MIAVTDFTLKQADIYNKFNIYEYLSSSGLCINRDYRGRGIAKKLLQARVQILKNLGLTVSASPFSATVSQLVAKSVGFEEIYEIR